MKSSPILEPVSKVAAAEARLGGDDVQQSSSYAILESASTGATQPITASGDYENKFLTSLDRIGAFITNSHIVYTSGKHGSMYVNKDAIYPHTKATSLLCEALAHNFSEDHVDVVLAPALGGIILSQWVAHHLSLINQREVLAVYAEKFADGFVIKRGYDRLLPEQKILVLEDVLTTGGSVRKVVELVRRLGGNLIGVGALFNRGNIVPEDLGHVPKLISLVNRKMETWDADQCPLCAQGVPINISVGKGREFLENKEK